MPSSFTSNVAFEKPADGEQTGSWGDTVNDNMDIVDRLTSQVGSIALTSSTYTLTTSTSGALSEGHYSAIKFTGTPGATCTVTINPNTIQRIYTIYNNTNQTVIMAQGSGSTVSIPAGEVSQVYSDGAGAAAAVTPFTDKLKDVLYSGDIGSTVQGYDADLAAIVALAKTDGNFIVGNGSTWVAESGNTALNSLGVTATATELNVLDGITASTAELNQLDGNVFTNDLTIPDKIVHTGDTDTAIRFPAVDTVTVETAGTERVKIDSNGLDTATKLTVNGAAGGSVNIEIGANRPAGTSGNSFIDFDADDGTTYPYGFRILRDDTNPPNGATRIIHRGTGLLSFGSVEAADIILNTSNLERMRIKGGGEVYIAGTTDQGAYNLQVNGTGVWGAGAYVNGSDERLKEDIADLAPASELVSQLRPVTFRYKSEYLKDQSVQAGFIAQELQAVLANEIYVDGIVQAGPEHLNVAYQALIPVLTKALQEALTEIAQLKARVAALET